MWRSLTIWVSTLGISHIINWLGWLQQGSAFILVFVLVTCVYMYVSSTDERSQNFSAWLIGACIACIIFITPFMLCSFLIATVCEGVTITGAFQVLTFGLALANIVGSCE